MNDDYEPQLDNFDFSTEPCPHAYVRDMFNPFGLDTYVCKRCGDQVVINRAIKDRS